MRIFYLVPRRTVDAVLPLKIAPTPATIERVFVGRVEMFSPAMQRTITAALESGDTKTLGQYGRFLKPFCDRLLKERGRVHISQAASAFLAGGAQPNSSPCRVEPLVVPTEQR